jgi:O-antigen/teichoic acid export membrane protein
VRLLVRTPSEDLLATHLLAKLVMGVGGQALVVILAGVAFGPEAAEIVAITGVGLIPSSLAGLLLVRRQVDLRLGSATPAVVAASAASTVGAILGVVLTHDARWFAAGLSAGDVLLLLLLWRDLPGRGWALGPALRLLRVAPPLVAMQIAYIGEFRVGTLMLGVVGSAVAVGEYTVATKIAEGLVILAAAISATAYPTIATALSRGDRGLAGRIFDRTYAIALLSSTLMVGGLVVLVRLWLSVLFPRYPGAGLSFALVGIAVILFFVSSQTTALLNAEHRDRVATASSQSGLIVTIIGTLVLAPSGAVGVSAARIVGEAARQLLEIAAIARSHSGSVGRAAASWFVAAPVVAIAIVAGLDQWHTALTGLVILAGTLATCCTVALTRGRLIQIFRG